MTTAPALLPCPFCGGDAELSHVLASVGRNYFAVECADKRGCRVVVSSRAATEAEAIAAWNARPGGDEADEWEYFCDESHFDFWCVRRIGDRTFGQGYHMQNGNEAKHLCETLNAQATALRARAQMERGK